MRRRLLATLTLVLVALFAAPAVAWADNTVSANNTTWTTGTWNVTHDVELSKRVEVSGQVVLHLGEGTTLTASEGIGVNGGNKLTIEGKGTLVARGNASGSYGNAGIGGTFSSDALASSDHKVMFNANKMGTIIIESGTIVATGGTGANNDGGAGIGSCMNGGRFGSVTINGGTVKAEGGPRGAGIGGGNGSTVDVFINGGTIEAKSGASSDGGTNAADIGGGNFTPSELSGDINVTINGGQIVTTGDRGIGAGWNNNGNTSGSVYVTLGWTDATDRIQGKYSLNSAEGASGGITLAKSFIKEGDESRTEVTEAILKGFGTSDAIIPPVWIVTFDSAGGSDVDEQRVLEGSGKATEPDDPERDDYTFEYWYTDDADTAFDFDTTITANTTLHAKWKRITHKVTFKANGGSGNMDDQTINQNETTKLSANEFTKDGHAFVEWNTADDGTGTVYTDEQEVTLTNGLTLYAQWRKLPVVSFDANGGDGTMDPQVSDTKLSVTLAGNAFTRTRYVFDGWNTQKDGKGTAYTDGATITLSDDTTLYAQWTYGVETSVKVGKGAPKLKCSNLAKVADELVTDEEASQGTEVWLEITAKEKAKVPAADVKQATAAATKLSATPKVWLDISLYKKVGDGKAEAVTKTSKALNLVVTVPSSIRKSGRTFYLIRVHDGKGASIANTKGKKLSGQSNLFSTYSIAYKNASSGSNSKKSSSNSQLAQTGDPNASAAVVVGLALVGAAVLTAGAWARRHAK